MTLEQHVPLSLHTTLGIGGPARWFSTAHTETDVREAVRIARQDLNVPLFILGGGSNLLVADHGFAGLVLRIALTGIQTAEPDTTGRISVRAAAGESWDTLVQYTVDRNLAGMECLAGIPGTVGGTPVQNVGAYGQEVAQTISNVRCLDTETNQTVDLSNAQCGFAYRTSLLNTSARGRYIVLRVDFTLKPNGTPNLSYADLQRAFPLGATPTLAQTAEAVRAIRRAKGMLIDPRDPDSRSAGSFFRNPIVPAAQLAAIAQAAALPVSQVPHWPAGNGNVKLPAAWLLERAGFVRGYTLGNAGISSRHTLALINRGNATAANLLALRDRIASTVRDPYCIDIDHEHYSLG